MMRALWLPLLAALAAVAFTAPAVACEGAPVLLADHFDAYDPAWGMHGEELTLANGQMVIRPEVGTMDWQTYGKRFGDVDLCVDATVVSSGDFQETAQPKSSFIGLQFWFTDDDDFYAFEVDDEGHAAIWQISAGQWHSPVPWGASPVVPTGDGKTMRLRVVTKGTTATTYVNDQLFKTISLAAPIAGGSSVGVVAGSPMSVSSVNTFDDFVVTQPQ